MLERAFHHPAALPFLGSTITIVVAMIFRMGFA